MKTVCVLVLVFASVYGRVTVLENDISPDAIASNTVHDDDSKIVKIKVITDKIIINNNVGHVTTADSTKKTCHIADDIDNNVVADENQPCVNDASIDNGTALLLTPYIEEGRVKEARNASRVNPELFLGIESYSGFLTVDKTFKSHLFFWYFPSLKPANDTPWIIWLQGGPGASSMTGLFDEIGPFNAENGVLKQNPHTWLHNHSLVFIDNPVGTGYSFTEHPDGFTKDMATYGKHLHKAVKQLVQIFPELRVAPLYISGESYAGKYVPALGIEIHRHRNVPGGDINLKGLIIGNAYIEPAMISQIVRPFYHFGLLEKEQIDIVKPLIDAFQKDIAANKSVEAKQKWNYLIAVFLMLSHQSHAYNFLRDDLAVGGYASFLDKPEIKRALHVGDIRFGFVNFTVNTALAPDFLSTSKPLFEELLEHYRVLAYCGQLDQMLPCAISSDSYRKWKWSASKEFLDASRSPFIMKRKLAGYVKSGGGMTWAVIRGAGHMVPLDAPAAAARLVTAWTRSIPLSAPDISHNALMDFIRNNTLVYL